MTKGKSFKAKVRKALFSTTVYFVWWERNLRVHDHVRRDSQQLAELIVESVHNRLSINLTFCLRNLYRLDFRFWCYTQGSLC